ncbi:uncharacterized protein LOC131285395 [Anopheles ziemanni]|uniref:uncharacterized protein LOC131285395 n=1 Tax=Anopheles ziemanni TaxID=345580 RepID=UPI00265F28CB|nr:uncharacterized protein LOC131285395 [Anopheles ziemanni]
MDGKSVLVADNLDAESNAFCRLCVEYTTEQTLFVSSAAIATLFKRIFECTGVRLIESPGLPKRICDVCTSQLVICERFIKKCREADQKCVDWRSKRAAALVGNLTPAPVAPGQQSKQECNTMKLEKLVNVNPTDGKSEEELMYLKRAL